MDIFKMLILLAVLLLPAGCDLPEEGDIDDVKSGSAVEICNSTASDEFDLDTVTIEGDSLKMHVWYGGGCQVHDFNLCWNGIFTESVVVQATLQLIHDSNQDMCEALISAPITFDLTPLKTAWQKKYQEIFGTIQIKFSNKILSYSF